MIKCPHCLSEIDHFDYKSRFSQTSYGYSLGTCTFDGCETEQDSQEEDGSDNFEEYDFEYKCPNCALELCEDDLIDTDIDQYHEGVKVDNTFMSLTKGLLNNC